MKFLTRRTFPSTRNVTLISHGSYRFKIFIFLNKNICKHKLDRINFITLEILKLVRSPKWFVLPPLHNSHYAYISHLLFLVCVYVVTWETIKKFWKKLKLFFFFLVQNQINHIFWSYCTLFVKLYVSSIHWCWHTNTFLMQSQTEKTSLRKEVFDLQLSCCFWRGEREREREREPLCTVYFAKQYQIKLHGGERGTQPTKPETRRCPLPITQ